MIPKDITMQEGHQNGGDDVENPLQIVGHILCFTILFSFMSVLIKLSSNAGVPIFTIMFFRYLFGTLPVTAKLIHHRKLSFQILTEHWTGMMVRTVMGLIGMWCVFTSLKMLPIAEATILHFASPFFLTLFSIYFLSEHVGKWRWSAIIAGFIGITIVLDPNLSAQIYGQIIAICAAIIMALSMTMVRSMNNIVSPEAMTFFVQFVGTLCALPLLIYQGFLPHTLEQWLFLLGAGLCAGVAQISLNTAYMRAPSAFVTSFNYIQIVFIAVLGYIVFGDVPSENFIWGALIIVGAGVVIALREYLLQKNKNAT